MNRNDSTIFEKNGTGCPDSGKPDATVDWPALPPDERKRALFAKQKNLLDTFLSKGAIDRRQYEKSLTCMAEKMGIGTNGKNNPATE